MRCTVMPQVKCMEKHIRVFNDNYYLSQKTTLFSEQI